MSLGAPRVVRATCPAKVNLALRVIERLPDGYHRLDTLFQAVDLEDTLEARASSELTLDVESAGVPRDESNLVLRAACALRDAHGSAGLGAAFVLRKRIPVGGGLGGGSSNAAGALLACRTLWRLEVGDEELGSLAARLGADVPFFLRGGTARGLGRGDRIAPLPPPRKLAFLLATPPFGVSTAEVFGAVGGCLTLPGIGVSLPLLTAHKWPQGNDFSFMVNDLERVVFARWPALASMRDALREAGARHAMLSGSGSTVFGIFDERQGALDAAARLGSSFGEWSYVTAMALDGGIRLRGGVAG